MDNAPRISDVVINEGIELKEMPGYFVGRCPFHDDRNPSFVIYKDSNYFQCFSCNERGDSIKFIRMLRGLSFLQATRYLGIKEKQFYQPVIPDIFELICREEQRGVNILDKYGNEFIDIIRQGCIVKNIRHIVNIQNKVKVSNPEKALNERIYNQLISEYRAINKVLDMVGGKGWMAMRKKELEEQMDTLQCGTYPEKWELYTEGSETTNIGGSYAD